MRSAKSPALPLDGQNSCEQLQTIVKREEKSARNLVAWSVPTCTAPAGSRKSGKVGARRRPVQLSRSERMCRAAAGKYSNTAYDEGYRPSNKADVQARYWSYLFDNLFRAVDEIYRTCEMDCSIIECKVSYHYVSVSCIM